MRVMPDRALAMVRNQKRKDVVLITTCALRNVPDADHFRGNAGRRFASDLALLAFGMLADRVPSSSPLRHASRRSASHRFKLICNCTSARLHNETAEDGSAGLRRDAILRDTNQAMRPTKTSAEASLSKPTLRC
jgi:hypothetical protein